MHVAGAVEHRLTVGPSEVRVVTAGSGSPAVLFDSPLGTPLEAWSLVAPAIAERTRVVLWDRPGIGRSGPFHPFSADSIADAMASVIEEVGAGPVVGVGHSRGGINVLALATRHPELVSGLVLVESSHPEQRTRLPTVGRPLPRVLRVLARIPAPLVQLPAVGVRSAMRLAGRRASPRTQLLAELAVAVLRRLGGMTAEHEAGPMLLAQVGDALADRGLPQVPLIVLTGDRNFKDPDDQAIWSQMHAELAALSDRGTHVHVPCGHGMPFTHPEAVVDAICDVFDRIARGAN